MSDGSPWDERALPHLQDHLQLALELELWTIPYYAVALASVADPGDPAASLLREIVGQELAHAVALANLANAFGRAPQIKVPRYGGPTLPHLLFDLDVPNPTSLFAPHTTALGALDHARLNTMCLFEFQDWPVRARPLRQDDLADYANLSDFHAAIADGVVVLHGRARADRPQVGDPRFAALRVEDGADAAELARVLTHVREHSGIDPDTGEPSDSHFARLNALRDGVLPGLLDGEARPALGSPAAQAQAGFADALAGTFASWQRSFAGDGSDPLEAELEGLVATARACWQAGALPRA